MDLNQGNHVGQLSEAEFRALAWLEKASRPVSALKDESVVCDVLDVLTVNLDGTSSAPEYFSRRRRVLHRMLGYAVRKKRLDINPVSKKNLPEGWAPPESPDEKVDPRCAGLPRGSSISEPGAPAAPVRNWSCSGWRHDNDPGRSPTWSSLDYPQVRRLHRGSVDLALPRWAPEGRQGDK